MNNHPGEPGDPGVSLAADGEQAVSAHAAPVCVSDFLLIILFTLLHFRGQRMLVIEPERSLFKLERSVLSDALT